jgi:hypothetical protein
MKMVFIIPPVIDPKNPPHAINIPRWGELLREYVADPKKTHIDTAPIRFLCAINNGARNAALSVLYGISSTVTICADQLSQSTAFTEPSDENFRILFHAACELSRERKMADRVVVVVTNVEYVRGFSLFLIRLVQKATHQNMLRLDEFISPERVLIFDATRKQFAFKEAPRSKPSP